MLIFDQSILKQYLPLLFGELEIILSVLNNMTCFSNSRKGEGEGMSQSTQVSALFLLGVSFCFE